VGKSPNGLILTTFTSLPTKPGRGKGKRGEKRSVAFFFLYRYDPQKCVAPGPASVYGEREEGKKGGEKKGRFSPAPFLYSNRDAPRVRTSTTNFKKRGKKDPASPTCGRR